MPGGLGHDPRLWQREDVAVFMRYCEREFDLDKIDMDKFQMNGESVADLRFYTRLRLWKDFVRCICTFRNPVQTNPEAKRVNCFAKERTTSVMLRYVRCS